GVTMRLKQRSSVVLPEPLSPMTATHAPARTSSDTPSRPTTAPQRLRTAIASRAGWLVVHLQDPRQDGRRRALRPTRVLRRPGFAQSRRLVAPRPGATGTKFARRAFYLNRVRAAPRAHDKKHLRRHGIAGRACGSAGGSACTYAAAGRSRLRGGSAQTARPAHGSHPLGPRAHRALRGAVAARQPAR